MDPIDKAVDDLNRQLVPNIRATAREYQLVESTLRRRWKGQTLSIRDAISEYQQRLTNAQEEALIHQINRLTDRGLPPTPRIVRNLAEEIIGGSVSKNWTSNFVKRHKDEIKSLHLCSIDIKRNKAEYAPVIKQFYDLVRPRWLYYSCDTDFSIVTESY